MVWFRDVRSRMLAIGEIDLTNRVRRSEGLPTREAFLVEQELPGLIER